MTVKYKYSNEDEVIILGANEYEVGSIPDQVVTFYQPLGIATNRDTGEERYWTVNGSYSFDQILTTINIESYDSNEHNTYSQNVVWGFEIERIYDFPRINATRLYGIRLVTQDFLSSRVSLGLVLKRNYELAEAGDVSSDDLYPILTSVPNTGIRYLNGLLGSGPSTLRPSNYEVDAPFTWHQFDITTVLYRLSIANDGLEVFSRTEIYPPEYVDFVGERCPEGTCPVRCNEVVCCYGSNGVATDSFLFEDSIYS